MLLVPCSCQYGIIDGSAVEGTVHCVDSIVIIHGDRLRSLGDEAFTRGGRVSLGREGHLWLPPPRGCLVYFYSFANFTMPLALVWVYTGVSMLAST